MSFPVENYVQKTHDREIAGIQKDAAVDCWFTSSGRTIPRLVKVEGEEGQIVAIQNIKIDKIEQKFYAGISARKHWCRAEINGVVKEFILLFYIDESKWKIIM